ncbi:MAG: DNA-processing protein DprA [Desulfovibrionaceae bacterium]
MSSLHALRDDEKLELWAMLSLQYTSLLTPILFKRLLSYYSTAVNTVKALSDGAFSWEHVGVMHTIAACYLQQEWKEKATAVWNALDSLSDITILLYTSEKYPFLLKNIADPPAILYCSGDITLLSSPSVAIIGSRRASAAGKKMTHSIASDMASFGLTVVSGLAEGIDTVAHEAALEHNATIAVLGTGINLVYPTKNKNLSENIQKKGCLVSEFPPNVPPKPHHFPIRNRIITGLTIGVLVVEAGLKSGSLVTAKIALDQGKEVYVVPPQYTSRTSLGTLQLLENGAKAIVQGKELFEDILPQISDSLLSPSVRAKLLEYQLSLSAAQKDYYQEFLDTFPSTSSPSPKTTSVREHIQGASTTIQHNAASKKPHSLSHEINRAPTPEAISVTKQEQTLSAKNIDYLHEEYSPEITLSSTFSPEEYRVETEHSFQEELINQSSSDIQYGTSPVMEAILSFLHEGNKSAEELFDLIATSSIDSITTELIMLELQSLIQKDQDQIYGMIYK